MERAVQAHSLISVSLVKLQSSRSLLRSLHVSSVLRRARQLYARELHQLQLHEELTAVCRGIHELDPEDRDREDRENQENQQNQDSLSGCRLGSAAPACCKEPEPEPDPSYYRSCYLEAQLDHCSRTTVLDLDTHVVTTVENGYLHQDCCWSDPLRSGKRKEIGCCSCDSEQVSDGSAASKRVKHEHESWNQDWSETSNISTLISIFGSGFSGLRSRPPDLEQPCGKRALGGLGAWTRTVVAF